MVGLCGDGVAHCVWLAAHGFSRGDRLAVIGDNRPRLYASMLAAQSLGGAAVPLWPDAEPDLIALVLNHAGASVVVAEDGEQVEKLVAIKDLVPGLRLVVQTAAHGMRQIEHAWLKSFEAVVDAGMGATMQCDPGDPALLHYATGSGGEVRGVTLTHAESARRRRDIGRHNGRQAERRNARLAADGVVRRCTHVAGTGIVDRFHL